VEQDILEPNKAEIENYQETDVFSWATNLTQYNGEEMTFELYLISKTYTLYRMSANSSISKQLGPMFINNILEYVIQGMDSGLIVRGFEESEDEEGVLQRTQLFKVEKAQETMNWVKSQRHEIETFMDSEHDFRRMKGILARVTTPNKDDKPFYIAKTLPSSNVMSNRAGWMIRDGKFIEFDAEAALKIPHDNQLLILDQDIYVFNQNRLKQLFSYDAKEASIAAKKAEEITTNFDLSFGENLDIQTLVAGKKSLIRKLQKIDTTTIKQSALADHAEELDIDLMTDESGAFIIEDSKDLTKFVNLLNDDYVESNLTGERYEIMRKKPIKPPKDDDLA